MSRLAAVVSAFVLVPAVAWASPLPDRPTDWGGRPSGGTRGYVLAPDEAFTPSSTEHHAVSPLIYVNGCWSGCTFTKSSTSDAISDLTIIGGVSQGTSMTLSPFGYSQNVWDLTIACIREVYSPYNVQVITDDPGAVPHHEAVMAGRGSEMSLPQGVLGIAPLDATTCEPKDNVISFAFANDHGGLTDEDKAINLCWTVAQESAHAYGLDHEFDCRDPMTYIPGCGQKFFRNELIHCGRNVEEQCICGGALQNSHARLLGGHGAGTPPAPPTVSIAYPTDGAIITGSTSVLVNATDRRGIGKVELYVNDWLWNQQVGRPSATTYQLPIPAQVPDGIMDLRVRACNDLDVCAEAEITVTRGSPCSSADACLTGQKCDSGRCYWDPPTAQIGDACTYPQMCVSTVCSPLSSGDSICSEECYGGPNDSCPDPFVCSADPGLQGVCIPPEEGGCCSTSRTSTDRLAVNLGLAGIIGLLVIRRRRRRA